MAVLRSPERVPVRPPIALQVELTSRCNLRCRMCPLTTGTSSSSADPGSMLDATFEQVLAMARTTRQVVLAGYGEPLTSSRCLPMLRALDAERIEVGMATNGLAITERIARELASIRHLTSVNVSIDSPDPDVYRAVRGGDVHRALSGLRNLVAAMDDPRRVIVSSVAMAETLPSLVAFPAMLAEIGVRRYELQAVIDYNAYAEGQRLVDHREMAALLEQVESECDRLGMELALSVPERSHADVTDPDAARARYYGTGDGWDELTTRQCHVPWEIPFVDKDGRVFACCFAAAANERQLGDLSTESFDEVWRGEPFQRFREDLLDGRTTPDVCRRCTVAPLGEHLFTSWAATILTARLVRRRGGATVRVVARNDGTRTWTHSDHVRVGSSSPRDCASPLAHPSWLSPDRAASFLEHEVEPGATATFDIAVSVPRGWPRPVDLELVADGSCWIPNTRFSVSVRRLTPAAVLVRRLARELLRRGSHPVPSHPAAASRCRSGGRDA